MPAVLRATGVHLDVDAFLAGSTLPVCASYRVGEPVLPRTKPDGHRRDTSGVHIDVSDADFDEFGRQVADAVAFLETHAARLQRLVGSPGVEDVTLDFGIARRDEAVQVDRLPAELLRHCGRLGLSVELSHYPPLG
jgi:hypothetical protein